MRDTPMLNMICKTISELTQAPDSYVSEAKLSDMLSISRTKLREMLQTLDGYGFIEKRQKLGIRTKPLSKEKVREVYEFRALLEGYAVEKALRHATPQDIKRLYMLDSRIQLAKESDDFSTMMQEDLEFHQTIVEISNQCILQQTLRNLRIIALSFSDVPITNPDYKPPTKLGPYTHKAIVEALERKDPVCAEIMRKHIQWTMNEQLEKFA